MNYLLRFCFVFSVVLASESPCNQFITNEGEFYFLDRRSSEGHHFWAMWQKENDSPALLFLLVVPKGEAFSVGSGILPTVSRSGEYGDIDISCKGIRVHGDLLEGSRDGKFWLYTQSKIREIKLKDQDLSCDERESFEKTSVWRDVLKPLLDKESKAVTEKNALEDRAKSDKLTRDATEIYQHAQQELMDSREVRVIDLLVFERDMKLAWREVLPKETEIKHAGWEHPLSWHLTNQDRRLFSIGFTLKGGYFTVGTYKYGTNREVFVDVFDVNERDFPDASPALGGITRKALIARFAKPIQSEQDERKDE